MTNTMKYLSLLALNFNSRFLDAKVSCKLDSKRSSKLPHTVSVSNSYSGQSLLWSDHILPLWFQQTGNVIAHSPSYCLHFRERPFLLAPSPWVVDKNSIQQLQTAANATPLPGLTSRIPCCNLFSYSRIHHVPLFSSDLFCGSSPEPRETAIAKNS